MQHIVNFSGGKDSTAMLLKMIEKGMPIDLILFVDTTKEFPEVYDHIQQVQNYVWDHLGLEFDIVKVEMDFDYFFSQYPKKKGKNKGERGYGWPMPGIRWCTTKKTKMAQTMINQGIVDNFSKELYGGATPRRIYYNGISYDEKERIDNQYKRDIQYPLVDWEITGQEALEYCYSKGFYWDGLYEKISRTSCYCCPYKRDNELKMIRNEYPELWQDIQDLDQNDPKHTFQPSRSVNDIEREFKAQERQLQIF